MDPQAKLIRQTDTQGQAHKLRINYSENSLSLKSTEQARLGCSSVVDSLSSMCKAPGFIHRASNKRDHTGIMVGDSCDVCLGRQSDGRQEASLWYFDFCNLRTETNLGRQPESLGKESSETFLQQARQPVILSSFSEASRCELRHKPP